MKEQNSATVRQGVAVPVAIRSDELPPLRRGRGTALAFLGVLAFSGSFPATVFAMRGFDPWLVAIGRAVIAGVVALVCLKAARLPLLPPRREWGAYALISLGVVFGFPVFSGMALALGASTSHSAVVIGLLPAATAAFAVLRAGERPRPCSGRPVRQARWRSRPSPSPAAPGERRGPTRSWSARCCRRRSATRRAAGCPGRRPAGGSSPTRW
ncbi:DMT family transporter [Nonomuraea sp. NBC_01738]|uniref:DMT family transporter n=1 Tax=Nonomuraea sp. NBC_01738 TaxID=2976003 RepID=UPI002E0F447C|nr:DMT family transporter [Nonomuraea sp. NBC_01738]